VAPEVPELPDVTALLVDLCSVVEAQMKGVRNDYQISIYEICLGLQNRITKEMDRLVYHVRRLIDQNGFLYDRVTELEKRDDPKKVLGRNRNLHDSEKGENFLHPGGSKAVDDVRRGVARRRVRSPYRQAG
jgi:hypothetical protein